MSIAIARQISVAARSGGTPHRADRLRPLLDILTFDLCLGGRLYVADLSLRRTPKRALCSNRGLVECKAAYRNAFSKVKLYRCSSACLPSL